MSTVHSYNSELAEAAAKDAGTKWLSTALFAPWQRETRAILMREKQTNLEFTKVEALLEQIPKDSSNAVCIIENIGPRWISLLGEAWNLPNSFFLRHAWKHDDDASWHETFMPCLNFDESPAQYIVGVFEYNGWKTKPGRVVDSNPNFMQRHCWEGPSPYPLSSFTCISSYRVNESLIIFLVDEPLDLRSKCEFTKSYSHPSLRCPNSANQGGVLLPPLYPTLEFQLSQTLTSVFSHSWIFQLLFTYRLEQAEGDPYLVEQFPTSAEEIVYLLSSSLFEANLRFLKDKIERISFNDLRNPDIHTNDILHDCRQELVLLRANVIERRQYMPIALREIFLERKRRQEAFWDNSRLDVYGNLSQLIEDANNLSTFLMDSFQLLISTVSTLDSQHSLEQAKRSTLLTQLALIYVPLSFVTGIYGMNIKEINGSPLSVWVAVVSLAILILLTLVIFWLLRLREDYKSRTKKIPKLKWKKLSSASSPLSIKRFMDQFPA